jgi:hypothetical protein
MPPSGPSSNVIFQHHRTNNRASAGGWDDFGEHRARLTALIETSAASATAGRLALIGAGNCNDVDLAALAARFRELHLFDLDAEAVARASARQAPEVAARLVVHAPVDVSGAYDHLPGIRARTLPAAELSALPDVALARALAAVPDVAGTFDTVVSACCLSQIMHSCFLGIGQHAQLDAVAGALGRTHLRYLLTLARPGGQVLLVSDMVSSETYPLEEMWGTRPADELIGDVERAGNFLSGTARTFMRRLCVTDPAITVLTAGPPTAPAPWLWRLGGGLTFLVYALAVTRRA